MKIRRRGLPLVASGLALGLAALSVPAVSAQATTKATTVHLLEASGFDFSDADIYQAVRILHQQNINLVISQIADPATALRALIANQADLYMDAPDTVALAVEGGATNIRYISSMYRTSAYVILALPKYNLKNLAGATLAIASPGSAGQVAAVAALTKLKVDVSKIQQVTVGGTSARVAAILAGQVDLAPALAPAAIPAVATGKVKILINTGKVLGNYIQQGLIANSRFIGKTAVAQAVVNAFIKADQWSATHESEYIALANANQLQGSLTAKEEQMAWTQLQQGGFWAKNGALCQSGINSTLYYDYQSGALKSSTMPKQSAWIDKQFVQAYLKAHKLPNTTC
jgi:ABC-type nitrate/sulfonate/bicarbonate transport system substrate-binding protein